MSDNKDFEKKLKDGLISSSGDLPESLWTENIVKLVKEEKQEKPKRKKTVLKAVAAAAAVFAIATVGVVLISQHEPPIQPAKPADTVRDENASVYTSDYAAIQDFFISLKNNQRYNNRSSAFNGIFRNEKAESVAAEDYASGVAANDGSTAVASASQGSSHSQTELQVEGVDEADRIKTDGKYLYLINGYISYGQAENIVIVDPSDPGNMKILANFAPKPLSNGRVMPEEFFLKDGKLIVIAREDTSEYERKTTDIYSDTVCCYVGSFGNYTNVYIYDLSNISSPALVDSYQLDGNYISSRITEGKLVVVSNYLVPLYTDDNKLKEACIPKYYSNGEEKTVAAEKISIIRDNEEDSYTMVMMVPLDKSDEAEVSSVLGGGHEVYCSKTDLYIAASRYANGSDCTQIFRFDLNDNARFKSEVKLNGSFLNQFSMDEYNGYFRIATTENDANTVTVLDKELKVIGSLKGIAKGEQIYAVRFIGNTAYVVTFLQTDPLFVIDLSNPEKPEIKGELKIPGFSNMLYPMGDRYLIGVGRDGDEDGNISGLKVSLYDISNPESPGEISKAVIKNSNYSPAEYEHKSFLRLGDGSSFIIPVYEDYGSYLCSFTAEGGKLSQYKVYSDSLEDVSRAAYIGNTLFAFDAHGITAFNLDSAETVSKLPLTNYGDEGIVLY